jgi:hypothetical protein
MKKSDRNLLLAVGAAGIGAYFLTKKKDGSTVSGIPGIGAILPNISLVPEKYRGQPSPLWLDAALWGSLGAAAGYYGLAGKKLL